MIAADGAPALARSRTDWAAWLQAGAVALLALLLYSGLRSELPIDDTRRFSRGIAEGVFEWDAAHLFMQPAAVLWHQALGFGAPAKVSQERFNAFCAAVSLGVLYLLLLRLGVTPLRRALLLLLAALAYNLLNLATSGHIKLAVLPFLTLSLYHAVLWEQDEGKEDRRLMMSALFLGVASAFLISSIVVAPFLALATVVVTRRSGRSWQRSILRFVTVGAIAGGAAALLIGFGYVLELLNSSRPRTFLQFLFAKTAVQPESDGLVQSLARGGFGAVQNFVYLGDFGAMLRSGDSAVLDRHRATLLGLGAVFAAALALLTWVYGGALLRLLRRRGSVVPWAFVIGTVAFAIPWNLNESDFYFQITFPTVVLMALAPLSRRGTALTAALLVLVAGTVLLGWSLPRKRYPLSRYNAELQSRLTEKDLAVTWLEWSGGPSLIFMDLPGVERLYVDRVFDETNPSGRFFPQVAGAIDHHLSQGGRVYLFSILDGQTWNSPWPHLRRHGLTPGKLERFFRERYEVVERGEMAEIPCWELRPKTAA